MPLRPAVSDNDHVEGNPNAAIEIVEYGDYQCPHCGRAYPIIKKLQHELGDRMKLIFRNFPLANIHPDATLAAIATEAAGLQGYFWEMHDIVFENQEELERDALLTYAAELNLDIDKFEKDLDATRLSEKVEADFESGIRSGVNATPTFFINGEKYNDGWESDRLLKFIRNKFGA